MDKIVKELLNKTKVSDLTDILESITESHNTQWIPVGERENNLATINLGSDPAAGLVERITNAIDAVFELKWYESNKPNDVKSPRTASEEWFNIPSGSLSNLEDARGPEIQEASDYVKITYRDSDQTNSPTVDIRDKGIGLSPKDFKETILSLQGNSKLSKLYLAGAFGQGGSTAISYSQYTIIISRPSKYLTGNPEEDVVSFTIVRFNPKNYSTDKHGTYEYLVHKKTREPFFVESEKLDFEPGTLVRHVSMELGKYSGTITAPTQGLWYLVHNYLFDPVIPYKIEDDRTHYNQTTRTVTGNNRLLSTTEYLEYMNESVQTFKMGKIKLKWWVLKAEGKDPKSRIKHYTQVSKPIIITFNGQKQGELPNTIIKKDLDLPYLDRYIIVQIDCDRLDGETRRNLFPTTRENIRESFIAEDLRTLLIETLQGDDELVKLNHDRKKRYLQRVDSSSIDNIRKRLAKRVSSSILAGGSGDTPSVLPPRSQPRVDERPKIPMQEPPTFIKITNDKPITAYPGRRFSVKFKTDADPAYFLNIDTFIAAIEPPNHGRYTGTTNIHDGYGVAYFKIDEETEPGDKFNVLLEVRPKGHGSISDEAEVVVQEFPETGSNSGNTSTPNINPTWVNKEDDFWYEENWDLNSVTKVVEQADEIDVFVSSENKLLNKLISRAQRRDEEAIDSIKDFYLEHISYYSILAHLNHNKLIESAESIDDQEIMEKVLEAEYLNACDTICGIMNEMFDLIIEE